MSDELKSCPFCGITEFRVSGGGMSYWMLQCAGCGARSGLHETEAELYAAWNKRAQSSIDVDEVVKKIATTFRCFGGGRGSAYNPLAEALKDGPLLFAAGVDVKDVVQLVANELTQADPTSNQGTEVEG